MPDHSGSRHRPTGAFIDWEAMSLRLVFGTLTAIAVVFWTTVLSAVLGTAAALAIARSGSALAKALDLLFMSPLLLPALAFGFAALVFIYQLGLRPNIPLLVLGHVVVSVPFVLRTTL